MSESYDSHRDDVPAGTDARTRRAPTPSRLREASTPTQPGDDNVLPLPAKPESGRSRSTNVVVAVVGGGNTRSPHEGAENGRAIVKALAGLSCAAVVVPVSSSLPDDLVVTGARTVVSAVLDPGFSDGILPDLCADLGLVSVGASAAALRSCADKTAARARLVEAGVAVPHQRLYSRNAVKTTGSGILLPAAVRALGNDVHVKPRHGLGGAGVKRVQGVDAAARALLSAYNYAEDVVIERTVLGDEFTVLMTGDAAEPMAVGIARVTYESDDPAAARWARRYWPAEALARDHPAVEAACDTARALALDGLFTVDLILDRFGTAWVIDVNALLDWRPEGQIAACVASSDATESQLLASLLRDAGASMLEAA